ncbi:MAG: aminoacyl-histidine dipeptidase [Clostridia bacterium]|nr:aminoacyl-histidine dipeptidase [Clostridia bacterium]
MNYITEGYQPAAALRYFEDICAIPHGSGNEKGVADYIEQFAIDHKLEYRRDALHNMFIRKPATAGYEDCPAVMLQGHTDMVCEKNKDTVHDFEHDPLKLYIEDGWLKAKGTTLGGDDGIAVALMLAILADDTIEHPVLECLFTVQEETGLDGAENFDYGCVTAARLINLDSEEEGEAIVGCAGGMRLAFDLEYETVPLGNKPIKLEITGLAGGHSGADIHLGRANAIKLMGRVLTTLYHDQPFNLIHIEGGSKTNAIPRECEAVISPLDINAVKEKAASLEKIIRHELSSADKGFKLRVSKASGYEKMLTYKDSGRVISLLSIVPYGIRTMSPTMAGLVESSVNPGVITMTEEKIRLNCSARSSVESVMDAMRFDFDELAKVVGATLDAGSRYPGWEYDKNSRLQRDFIKTYKAVFGADADPKVRALHAGLECGIIKSKIAALGGSLDAISIGPNAYDIHTPDEKLGLASVEKIWHLVLALIKLK